MTTTVLIACSSAAALVTAMKVLTTWAPVRWVWRQLVVVPVAAGLHQVVRAEVTPLLNEIRHELDYNSGGSVKDMVRSTRDQVKHLGERVASLEQKAERVERRDPD